MSKKSTTNVPAPDPAIGQAALRQAELGEKQLSFVQDAYAKQMQRQEGIDALSAQVTRNALDTQKEQAGWARDDRQRYMDTVVPMEQAFFKEAQEYDSAGRQEARAAEAAADVQSAAAAQRGAAQRSAAAMGIDPRSGRYAGIDRASELTTALGTAGARNNARNQVRAQGLALRGDAINIGRGLPSQSLGAASLGLSAGGQAMGSAVTANNVAMGNTQLMQSGYNAASAGHGAAADTLNNLYGNQLSAYNAQQQAAANQSSGLGQTIGAVAGIAAMFM